ncbi:MAG TPA: MurR/RpiR family transcriptional regulator [Candidatus Erysipelatoclostridium merdavium]|uniref:MurR/RpiR family transcriptional regulator n=1 Tax=Candidatus Erysipelatoclostridium merdavium TaxID=2838566 RepID=A0A9D1XLB7_9FIRM|nr:MurR/RpiR family transcriptional regulator [Candidatus Erysipelatoclostridium merdavium]
MNIMEQFEQIEKFTKTELEIIDYIRDNSNALVYMSIGELAKETYSSNASIIRICKKLGYKGFRNFKMDYLREMESLKYVNNDIDFSFSFNSDEPTWQIINSLSSMYKESIDLINGELDVDELEKIVNLLDRSNWVFVYASGDSRISAMGFTNKLIKIGKFFYIVTDNREEVAFSMGATENDVALFIAYSKHYLYKDCLRILLHNHCPIITITSLSTGILYKYSNYHILVPQKESNEKIATFYSQLSFQYALSIIYLLLYKKYQNRLLKK